MKPTQISALITSIIFSTGAMAQEAPATELGQMVVTATKTEQSIDRVSATVQVVTEEDIAKMGASTLKDIFQNTPGLILQYGTFPSGSSASKSSVNIRGVGATGSLWLVDGRRLSGEVKNPYDMDRIPASMIERIEIVKGPMSALYGADAVGGVINIITKQPKDGFDASVGTSYGANANGDGANTQLNASARGSSGKFRGSFYVSSTDSTPYAETEKATVKAKKSGTAPPATPPIVPVNHAQSSLNGQGIASNYAVGVTYREKSKVNTVGGRGEYEINDKLSIGAEFNWFDEIRNGTYRGKFHPTNFMAGTNKLPAFDVPVNSEDKNNRLDLATDINYDINDDLDIKFRVYRSYYEKRNTTTMAEFADFNYASEKASSASGMSANVDIASYELSSNWQLNDNHLLTAGVEHRDEKREATVFRKQNPQNIMDTRKVSYQALYLQDDLTITDDLRFTVGGRYDIYNQDAYTDSTGLRQKSKSDAESTFRVGMVKNFSKMTNLRLSIAQGYRVPDIRELFIYKATPVGMQIGAQAVGSGKTELYDLKAEKTLSYEIGLSGKNKQLSYSLVAFQNDIKDKIEKISVGSGPGAYHTFVNVDDAQTQGAELTLSYAVSNNINTKLFWTELKTEDKKTGKDLEFNPARVVSVGVDYDITSNINLGLNVTHTGEQNYSVKTPAGSTDKTTDAYTLSNLTANYRFGKEKMFNLNAGINNIADTKVDKELGSNVGTYYFAGLKVNF